MNILITAPNLDPVKNVSGISTVVNLIITNNKQHNYFHYLLGRPNQPMNKLIWLYELSKQILFFPFFLNRNKIVLVHQNVPLNPKGVLREFTINLWCRIMNIPVILHIHGGVFILRGTKNALYKKLINSMFCHAKQVLVLSELEKETLLEKFNFSFAKVLSNSIDTTLYEQSESKQNNDCLNLLYLGRIEKNKGIYELIEALKFLKKDIVFQFILCGEGPLRAYCVKELENILGSNFQFKGAVFGIEKNTIINESTIFILPSYFEGLPMALLETMAAGVIPVVTNVGSIKSVINDGVNGVFVQKQNPYDLYEKLKYLLSNPKKSNSISKNARETIVNAYDIKTYIIKLNEFYELSILVK